MGYRGDGAIPHSHDPARPKLYRTPYVVAPSRPIVALDRSGYDYCMTEEKNPVAVELGRLGGKKGDKAYAEKLTKEQRSGIARKAAKARWEKKRQEEGSS